MKKSLFTKFSRISSNAKPHQLRYFYQELTGDCSAPSTISQAKIDDRVRSLIEMEDPHIVADLRSLNSSTERAKFDRFWDECQAVLNEEVGIAVYDRRHTKITHLATARDFFRRLPEDAPVPRQE